MELRNRLGREVDEMIGSARVEGLSDFRVMAAGGSCATSPQEEGGE